MRIILLEETRFDISALEKLGDVVTLFPEGESRRPIRDQKLENQILCNLDAMDFNPLTDKIALIGPQVSTAVFISTLVSMFGQVSCFVFDATRQNYYERSFGHLSGQSLAEVCS